MPALSALLRWLDARPASHYVAAAAALWLLAVLTGRLLARRSAHYPPVREPRAPYDPEPVSVPPDVDAIRAWLAARPMPESRALTPVEEFAALALHRRRSACFRSRYDRRARTGVENPGRAA